MTELRKKRLLMIASSPNGSHKQFYHLYVELIYEGLVSWNFGSASLTEKGCEELNRLRGK